jgi:hypothetical protein
LTNAVNFIALARVDDMSVGKRRRIGYPPCWEKKTPADGGHRWGSRANCSKRC